MGVCTPWRYCRRPLQHGLRGTHGSTRTVAAITTRLGSLITRLGKYHTRGGTCVHRLVRARVGGRRVSVASDETRVTATGCRNYYAGLRQKRNALYFSWQIFRTRFYFNLDTNVPYRSYHTLFQDRLIWCDADRGIPAVTRNSNYDTICVIYDLFCLDVEGL